MKLTPAQLEAGMAVVRDRTLRGAKSIIRAPEEWVEEIGAAVVAAKVEEDRAGLLRFTCNCGYSCEPGDGCRANERPAKPRLKVCNRNCDCVGPCPREGYA